MSMDDGDEVMPVSVETLHRVIYGIPKLSPEISDPARHEKILTFIESVCAGSRKSLDVLVVMGAMDVFAECTPHCADARITSLALRLASTLMYHAPQTFTFSSPSVARIMAFVVGDNNDDNGGGGDEKVGDVPTVLFGKMEMLGKLVGNDEAVLWMIERKDAVLDTIMQGLSNENLFVSNSSIKLLTKIITQAHKNTDDATDTPSQAHHALFDALVASSGEVVEVVTGYMRSGCRDSRIKGLGVVQAVCEAGVPFSDALLGFLCRTEWIELCFKLITDPCRLTSHRASSILTRVYTNVPRPIHINIATVLCEMVDGGRMKSARTCYGYLSVLEILCVCDEECGGVPLDVTTSIITHLVETCIPGEGKGGVQQVAQTADGVAQKCFAANEAIGESCSRGSVKQQEVNWRIVGCAIAEFVYRLSGIDGRAPSPLDMTAWTLRIAKSAYKTASSETTTFRTLVNLLTKYTSTVHEPVTAYMKEVLSVEDVSVYSVAVHQSALEMVRVLVEWGGVLTETAIKWIHALLGSDKWEIQDTCLDWITLRFKQEGGERMREFLTKHAYATVGKIAGVLLREVPFVRSTGLECLEVVVGDERWRKAVGEEVVDGGFVGRLVVEDTEAFVRRSAVGLLSKLVAYGMVRIGDDSEAKTNGRIVSIGTIGQCCRDHDVEVRVQAVHLLRAVFGTYEDMIVAMEEKQVVDKHAFFVWGCDKLVEAMTMDGSRMVRNAVLEDIKWYLDKFGNRKRGNITRMDEFVEMMKGMDVQRLEEMGVAEHMYSEVLEMGVDVFIGDDDDHVSMGCYDC